MEGFRGKAETRATPRETAPDGGAAFWTKILSSADAFAKANTSLVHPVLERHEVPFRREVARLGGRRKRYWTPDLSDVAAWGTPSPADDEIHLTATELGVP